MDQEILAITLTFVVHVVAVGALIWHLLQNDDGSRPDWRGWFRSDDEPFPPVPGPAPRGGDLPLPDAAPSGVRLREPARLGDVLPKAPRRPAHAPKPVRAPVPAGAPERDGEPRPGR